MLVRILCFAIWAIWIISFQQVIAVGSIISFSASAVDFRSLGMEEVAVQKLLEIHKNDSYLLNELGNISYKMGKPEKAKELWSAASVNPNLPTAEVQMVFALLSDSRLDDAAQLLTNLKVSKPNDPHIHVAAAQLMMLKKNFGGAKEALDMARQVAPELPVVLVTLGNYLENVGDTDSAIFLFQRATELDPRYNTGWMYLAMAHFRKGNTNGALAAYQGAKSNDARQPLAESRLGELYSRVGDYYKSYKFLKRSLEIDPENHVVRVLLGNVLEKSGRKDEALAEYRVVLSKGDNPAALKSLAQYEYSQKNWKTAIDLYRRVLAIDPNDVIACNNMAMLLVQTNGSAEESEILIRNAVKISDGRLNEFLNNTLGCVLVYAGKYTEADPILRKSIRENAFNQAWSRFSFAKVLVSMGKNDEAKEELAACMYLDPAFDAKSQVEKLLLEIN